MPSNIRTQDREGIDLATPANELLTIMSAGNPGALNAMINLLTSFPPPNDIYLHMDDMNLRGPLLAAAYEASGRNIETLQRLVTNRDKSLVDNVNQLAGGASQQTQAVVSGASSGSVDKDFEDFEKRLNEYQESLLNNEYRKAYPGQSAANALALDYLLFCTDSKFQRELAKTLSRVIKTVTPRLPELAKLNVESRDRATFGIVTTLIPPGYRNRTPNQVFLLSDICDIFVSEELCEIHSASEMTNPAITPKSSAKFNDLIRSLEKFADVGILESFCEVLGKEFILANQSFRERHPEQTLKISTFFAANTDRMNRISAVIKLFYTASKCKYPVETGELIKKLWTDIEATEAFDISIRLFGLEKPQLTDLVNLYRLLPNQTTEFWCNLITIPETIDSFKQVIKCCSTPEKRKSTADNYHRLLFLSDSDNSRNLLGLLNACPTDRKNKLAAIFLDNETFESLLSNENRDLWQGLKQATQVCTQISAFEYIGNLLAAEKIEHARSFCTLIADSSKATHVRQQMQDWLWALGVNQTELPVSSGTTNEQLIAFLDSQVRTARAAKTGTTVKAESSTPSVKRAAIEIPANLKDCYDFYTKLDCGRLFRSCRNHPDKLGVLQEHFVKNTGNWNGQLAVMLNDPELRNFYFDHIISDRELIGALEVILDSNNKLNVYKELQLLKTNFNKKLGTKSAEKEAEKATESSTSILAPARAFNKILVFVPLQQGIHKSKYDFSDIPRDIDIVVYDSDRYLTALEAVKRLNPETLVVYPIINAGTMGYHAVRASMPETLLDNLIYCDRVQNLRRFVDSLIQNRIND